MPPSCLPCKSFPAAWHNLLILAQPTVTSPPPNTSTKPALRFSRLSIRSSCMRHTVAHSFLFIDRARIVDFGRAAVGHFVDAVASLPLLHLSFPRHVLLPAYLSPFPCLDASLGVFQRSRHVSLGCQSPARSDLAGLSSRSLGHPSSTRPGTFSRRHYTDTVSQTWSASFAVTARIGPSVSRPLELNR